MPTIEVERLGSIDVTITVLQFLLEIGVESPFPLESYNAANEMAEKLARSFVRLPEDKPDPADSP